MFAAHVARCVLRIFWPGILRIKQPSDFEQHNKEYSSNLELKAISNVNDPHLFFVLRFQSQYAIIQIDC